MNAPNENDKKSANNLLSNLELMLLNHVRFTDEYLEPVRRFLKIRGFSFDSEEFCRFDEIERRALRLKDRPLVKYIGLARGEPMQIRLIGGSLFLVRAYYHHILVTWKFDSEGKIRKIDSKIKNQKETKYAPVCKGAVYPLIYVNPRESLNWKIADVKIVFLPEELNAVYSDFIKLGREEKIDFLIKEGHKKANYLERCLDNNWISQPYIKLNAQENQRPLINIKGDRDARKILSMASQKQPFFEISPYSTSGILKYE